MVNKVAALNIIMTFGEPQIELRSLNTTVFICLWLDKTESRRKLKTYKIYLQHFICLMLYLC